MMVMDPSMPSCRACGGTLRLMLRESDYPIFHGCTDAPPEADETYTLTIAYCEACDLVQQATPPPLDVLYREPRAFGYGPTWQGHYDAFAQFVLDASPGRLIVTPDTLPSIPKLREAVRLEVGGGNGALLSRLRTKHCVEPHPQYDLPDVTTYRCYFEDYASPRLFDCVYASHLIEHALDPVGFFTKAAACLAPGGSVVTACPDFYASLQNDHLNAITADHLNYFTPTTLARVAARAGLVVTRTQGYRDHGMYLEFRKGERAPHHIPEYVGAGGYTREPAHTVACAGADCVVCAEIRKRRRNTLDPDTAFTLYRDRIRAMAERVPRDAYLYGAHTFTICMTRLLPPDWPVQGFVLDNEPTKHGRRLTGTRLICAPPAILAHVERPTVALYAGTYSDEIAAQLLQINPKTNVVRLT